nr:putative glycoside hydrolase [uncultured Methanobrevibacter sp.]
MKNKIFFCFIILLTLFLTISSISASENVTCDNLTSVSENHVLANGTDLEIDDVENISSTDIVAEDKVSYVDYDDDFTVTLISNGTALANKNIKIILNNVAYNRTTNSYGHASINFKLKVGVYTVSYSFDGDENYTSSNGTSTLTVKSNLVTYLNVYDKDITYREGLKSMFQLKLVDIYGRTVANQIVTIKVGGKTYNAKTNSKGIATFYLKLKKGTYAVTYSFAGNGKYVATSGSYSLNVKEKLTVGNGYWVNKWDMKKVNLKKLYKLGTKHIFLLHTVFDKYGKSTVVKWINKAHKYGMKVHIWISVFYKGKFIKPCSKKGVYNYKHMNKIIEQVKYYASIKQVDGIHFDYLRFPGTAHKYKNAVSAINYFTKKACSEVRKINPNIIVSAAVMPEPNDMKRYYGQDVPTLSKYLDVIVPMIYKGNYHASSKWIKKTTKAFVKKSKGSLIWTGLQTYHSDSNIKKLSYKSLFNDAKAAKNGGAKGVVMFRWGLTKYINFKKLKIKV